MSLQQKKTRKKHAWVFGSLNKRFYRFVQNGSVAGYMTSYDASCEKLENSRLLGGRINSEKKNDTVGRPVAEKMPEEAKGIVAYESDTLKRGVRDKFAEMFDQSKLVCGARKLKSSLLNTSLVSYGLVLFGFALFLLITQALAIMFTAFDVPLGVFGYVGSRDTVLTITYMAVAVVLMALSLIFIFAQEGSLASFMANSTLIGSLLRATTGLSQFNKVKANGTTLKRKYSFILGAFLGLLSFLTTPGRFFIGLLITLLAAIVVNIPEFGLIVGVFALPYLSFFQHPTLIAISFLIVLHLSVALKLLRGKRIYRKEPLDIFVGLFLLCILMGGIVTAGGKDSLYSALTMTVLGSVYFAVCVLVRDRAWLKRCLIALMASSIPVSLLAILEFVLGKADKVWQDVSVFPTLAGRAASLWGNPNVLAEFLLVTFFVSFGFLLVKQPVRTKLFCLVTLMLNAAALLFTWSRGAWVALAVTLIVFFLMYSHKSFLFIVLSIAAFVSALVFMPETFVTRVESILDFSNASSADTSITYRLHIWQGCASLIRDVFWSGVGVGGTAFANAYRNYALPGIEGAAHSHNLYMQLVIELGIVGLVLFLLLVLTVSRVAFTLFAKCRIKHPVSLSALGVFGAIIALLLHGVTDYIWYNFRIFMLFFLLIGILAAARRIGKHETEIATNDQDSYDMDILIRG